MPAKKRTITKYEENYDDFVKWYRGFCQVNGGMVPLYHKAWFDRVQDKHKDIRELLGGIRNVQEIQVPKMEGCIQIDSHNLAYILTYIPNYLKTYNLSKKDLCNPNLPNGIKTTKHMNGYLSKVDLDYYTKDYLSNYISALGQEYANNRVEESKYYLNITTSAKSFARIGHYSSDSGSCFAQYGGNVKHKFVLGQTENTFVVLFHTTNIDPLKDPENEHDSVVARSWGFYNPKDETFNVCNYYPIRNHKVGASIEGLKAGLKNILKSDKINFFKNKIKVNAGVFHNKQKNDWTFSTKKDVEEQTLKPYNRLRIAHASNIKSLEV